IKIESEMYEETNSNSAKESKNDVLYEKSLQLSFSDCLKQNQSSNICNINSELLCPTTYEEIYVKLNEINNIQFRPYNMSSVSPSFSVNLDTFDNRNIRKDLSQKSLSIQDNYLDNLEKPPDGNFPTPNLTDPEGLLFQNQSTTNILSSYRKNSISSYCSEYELENPESIYMDIHELNQIPPFNEQKTRLIPMLLKENTKRGMKISETIRYTQKSMEQLFNSPDGTYLIESAKGVTVFHIKLPTNKLIKKSVIKSKDG
ncbi:hypothetical protein HZS_4958, partial [Henneguya salminicola]